MKLAVSNICWKKKYEKEILNYLFKKKIYNLEIAPTLIHKKLNYMNYKNYKNFNFLSKNFNLISMQSLLFGEKNCYLFREEYKYKKLIYILEKKIKLANLIGIKNVVFGSPKNKNIPDDAIKNIKNIKSREKLFFNDVINICNKYDVIFSIEANSKNYNTNYINTTIQAIKLCRKYKSKYLKINLDLGAVEENNENLYYIFTKYIDIINHIHISAPFLELPDIKNVNRYLSIFKKFKYKKYISFEFKPQNFIKIKNFFDEIL